MTAWESTAGAADAAAAAGELGGDVAAATAEFEAPPNAAANANRKMATRFNNNPAILAAERLRFDWSADAQSYDLALD